MGAKASKDKVEGSLLVMIVLGGGKRETYSRPVSALEVMLRHPQHVLTRLNVLRSDIRKAIVTPETVLLPGNKYYLVSLRTIEWLLDHHLDLPKTLINLNNSTSGKSDSGIDPLHIEISLGSGATTCTDDMSLRLWDSTIASPWHSQAVVEQKPSIPFTEEQLQTARGISERETSMKSPLQSPLRSPFIMRSSENTPRSRRSSPKVSPGGDTTLWDERISDLGLCMFSPVKDEMIWKLESIMDDGRLFPSPIEDKCKLDQKREKVYHAPGSTGVLETSWHVALKNDLLSLSLLVEDKKGDALKEKSSPLLSRSTSMQPEIFSKQEALACNLPSRPPALVVANNATSALQGDDTLHHYQWSLSLSESTEASKKKPLFQLLKYPDLNIAKLVEGKQECILPATLKVDSEVHESNKQNNPDFPVVEPVGVMLEEEERSDLDDDSCLHQDDKHSKQSQSHASQEPHSQADLGGLIIDKIHNIAQAYDNDKEWADSTRPQIAELGLLIATCDDEATKASQQKNDGITLSESLLLSFKKTSGQFCQGVEEEASVLVCQTIHGSKAMDVDGSNNKKSCKDLNKQLDQQKEGSAYMPPESRVDQQTSNLALSLNKKSAPQLCQDVGVEASVLVCETTHGSEAIDVDDSNNKKSCKDFNKQLDQPKEGCAYMPPENMVDQETSNLTLSFDTKSGLLCQTVEEEASLLGCQATHGSKAIDVDGSNNKKSCKDFNNQLVPTLDDVFLGRSPNHLEVIDSGIGQGEKSGCGMSDVSSLSLSSSLSYSSLVSPLSSSSSLSPSSSSSLSSLPTFGLPPCSSSCAFSSHILSSSSSSLSPSLLSSIASSSTSSTSSLSLHVSGSSSVSSSSQSNLSSMSSSSLSSSSPATAAPSLSLLMSLDPPRIKRSGKPQQVSNYAKTQRNLAILGFSSLRSDSMSIFEQAKGHRRAHLGESWKVASSKMSSSVVQEQERFNPSKQKTVEKRSWQPFSVAPRSPTINQGRSFPMLSLCRIRHLLLQPSKRRPLSPIREFSPELSPAYRSPLSDCPSSSF